MSTPLDGKTVALAEGRQLEELAAMLVKEGAQPLRYPLVSILDAPDPAPLVAWLHELIADRFSHVVLFTGEGLRRLLVVAEREGIKAATSAALGRCRTVTRGPKPGQALREVGLTPSKVAAVPTTDGVIATLGQESLRGQTVGVQLYKPENLPLKEFLVGAGATVREVLPYIYAPAADAERASELIARLAAGEIDVLIFTSSPQVDRLFEVAGERALDEVLRDGFKKTRVAVVGPLVAENLRLRGVHVDVCPEQGFVMKNLVLHVRRSFETAP